MYRRPLCVTTPELGSGVGGSAAFSADGASGSSTGAEKSQSAARRVRLLAVLIIFLYRRSDLAEVTWPGGDGHLLWTFGGGGPRRRPRAHAAYFMGPALIDE